MRCQAHASGLALVSLIAALGSLAACGPRGHVEGPAQPPVSGDPGPATVLLAGEPPAGYRDQDDGNRLGDTPARADDYSRFDAQLASEITGTPHINDVARRVRYNGAYFEIDVEVSGERGIVPVTWDMLRAHTPLVSQAYYARVYTSRGWSNGRQVPGFGPDVILPEAFTPELTPVIFEYFKRAFVSWSRDFDGWPQEMANAWMKAAAIHVARLWTPEYVGGVAVASARASQITGRMALGAAAVPNAAAATRACAGGRCSPATTAATTTRGRLGTTAKPLPPATGSSPNAAAVELSPGSIRFSQRSVNAADELTASMRDKGWKGDPIDVVRMPDGGLTAADNTRVLAAHRAGIKVQANVHSADELLPAGLIERFTTSAGVPRTWGDAIRLRIQKQGTVFRDKYPYGSPITGSANK